MSRIAKKMGILTFAALIAAVTPGCGASRDSSTSSEPHVGEIASVGDVQRVFREIGIEMEVRARYDGDEVLPVGLTSLSPMPREPAVARYGEFSVGIFDDVGIALEQGVFGDVDALPTGVTWQLTPESSCGGEMCWVARKLYGNVQLLWPNAKRRVDHRWTTLDSALGKLASS